MQRGVPPAPLKRLPVIFVSQGKLKVGGAKLSKGGGRNDLFRYVAKISHPIFERLDFVIEEKSHHLH